MWRPETVAYMYLILGKNRLSVKQFQQERVYLQDNSGSSSLRIKSNPLGGKMRSRINAVVILAVALVALTAVSSAKGVQRNRHQLPTAGLMDGPGPMCISDRPCGLVDKTGVRPILLTDGGGPMCFPGIGCGYIDRTLPNANFFPADILLADGGGPMCFPGIGCGRNVGLVYGSSVSKS
jgi:hypothetical protein